MEEQHVDIVRTEPLLGVSEVVARFVLVAHSHIKVIDDAAPWAEVALRPIAVGPNRFLRHDEEPEEFLMELPKRLGGTYIYATNLHTFDECPHPKPRMALEPIEYPPVSASS